MSRDIFHVKVRRCKRCGGLLFSEAGLKNGYGSCCLQKLRREEAERQMQQTQYSLFPGEGAGCDERA